MRQKLKRIKGLFMIEASAEELIPLPEIFLLTMNQCHRGVRDNFLHHTGYAGPYTQLDILRHIQDLRTNNKKVYVSSFKELERLKGKHTNVHRN